MSPTASGRYSLVGDGAEMFTIDQLSGQISIATALDREETQAYQLKVREETQGYQLKGREVMQAHQL